jgi:two-component system response regulator MprA
VNEYSEHDWTSVQGERLPLLSLVERMEKVYSQLRLRLLSAIVHISMLYFPARSRSNNAVPTRDFLSEQHCCRDRRKMMKAHILVVDDDPRITDLVRRILAYEGYSVAIATSGNEALTRTLERPPDLIVLDLMLPGLDGLEVARRLRAAGDNVPILMLTARDAVADRVEGLETGADDYLVKPFAPEELLARMKALLRRNQEERHEVLRYADVELDTGTRIAHRGVREIELSPTEYELLALFLRRPRQVLAREIILDRVWGIDFEGSSNVMEVYVGYLRAKLEAEGEPRLIHTVRGVGYVLKE